jgi:chromosome partitioning protein
MRTIAIANQKGGCGKTTTSVNLAAAFAEYGKRTLIMDLDPQGHSTLGFGYNPETLDKTVYHALTNVQIPLPRVIIDTNVENLDMAPSNILLSGAELEMANVIGREFVLSEQFRLVSDQYDVCVMDCPPSLGLLTLNALIASTDVIVPVQVNYYAMEGLRQLLETADIIKMNFQPCYVKILGLLLTFVEDRTTLSRQIQHQMREFFGDLVFDTVIHRTVRLAEAPSAGESVLTYAPNSKGAAEYMALVEEIERRELQAASSDQTEGQEALTEGQEALTEGQEDLTEGQEALTEGQEALTEGQEALTEGQEALTEGQEALTEGQDALSETLDHSEAVD